MFPRIAIHTGNKVVLMNKHPEWEGTIVLQHNETTSTMLKFGDRLSRAARNRHPLLSTFQSDCEAGHWAPFVSDNNDWGLIFGQIVVDGEIVSINEPPTVGVQPVVAHG